MRVSALRLTLGAAGLVVTGYGGWLLLSRQDLDRLVNLATWVVSGIV